MKMLGVRLVGLSHSLEKGLPLAKLRTSASTNSIKNHKSLEASAVVGKLSDTVHSVPDSSMLEMMSLFGSTSSSPLLANLWPNRVHVEDSGGRGEGEGKINKAYKYLSQQKGLTLEGISKAYKSCNTHTPGTDVG
ncbi:hypothetical protein SO802_028673 [Lithocarpus litseifolius]|uniref:Uncharacterized protein n=1 Tax=Lithocarpus litseifolius TaxID=425828 RepID=A0AAW2BQZ1_9ROSI